MAVALLACIAAFTMSDDADALPGAPVEYTINVDVGEEVEIGGDDFGIAAGPGGNSTVVAFTWIANHPSWLSGDRYHLSGTPTEAGTYYVKVNYGIYGPPYGPGINNYSTSTITIVVSEPGGIVERTMWLYYDLNGSTSPGFGNQSWTGTTDAVFRIDSSEPVLEGHEFVGWARTADASEAEWQPGDTVTVPYGESLRIYAVWKEYFTVTFSTGQGSAVDPQEILDGSTASAPSEPVREGWIFTGWFTDPSCQTPFSFLTPVTSDLILYAGWVEENAFTSVPTIEANVVRADGTLRFDASGTSDAQRKVWYLDGEIVGYGDVLEVDLSTISEGSHTVTLEATNTEGTDTWTYSFSADVDDGGIPLWFWIVTAVMLVAAVLCLIRVPWLVIVPLAAEAAAVLIVMIS